MFTTGVALLLFSATSVAAPETCEAARSSDFIPPGVCAMPRDVQALVVRQSMCDHFAGEEPYDDERRREIEDAIRESCGNEKRAAKLMARYRKDQRVDAWLRDYARQSGLTTGP